MKRLSIIVLSITLLFYAGIQDNKQNKLYEYGNPQAQFVNNSPYQVQRFEDPGTTVVEKPENIILLIADGMGVSHLHAALTANRGNLFIENLKQLALVKTHSASHYITDSGAGGTAIATGTKTYNGAIGVNTDTVAVTSFLELAEKHKKATGLISTSSITHATPASFIAHVASRKQNEAIAACFLDTDIDLFIGGGSRYFAQRKTDDRNLIDELKKKGYTVLQELDKLSSSQDAPVAVLTAEKHNPPYQQRGDLLPQATEKAITILSKNETGFFLMVEGSQVDWGAHDNDAPYLVEEMLDFDRTVGKAIAFAAKNKKTLVIVTADHETGGVAVNQGNSEEGSLTLAFTSDDHTATMIPLFAFGSGAKEFSGIIDNTEIFHKLKKLADF